ncbi:cupin [Streptomyces sp. ACA25]|uniref:cupin n=1 Tax=Streptomyces sp. ACA25 TaxID=3022596 RepID=UPI002306F2C3|nr:cupin [Streptomyces sp. ACA25]MDB1088271.1 cupin [Streptomyces sp. ACA25]
MEDLIELAQEHMEKARSAPHGRSAHLFLQDGPLRQSIIALTEGSELDEHNSPPAASLQVLQGSVRITGTSEDVELATGHIHKLPQERHGLRALEDAIVVLTAVTAT